MLSAQSLCHEAQMSELGLRFIKERMTFSHKLKATFDKGKLLEDVFKGGTLGLPLLLGKVISVLAHQHRWIRGGFFPLIIFHIVITHRVDYSFIRQ
jgi:hypothetical protein